MKGIFVNIAQEADIDFFEDAVYEQLVKLENFCLATFLQLDHQRPQSSTGQFPSLLYVDHHSICEPSQMNYAIFILNKEAIDSGFSVYFQNCSKQRIDKVVAKICSLANEAIDFKILAEPGQRYRVIKPKQYGLAH